MIIIDTHPFVFKHVKTMVEELCKSSKYDDYVLVLGYNVMPIEKLYDLKRKYKGMKIAVYNLEQFYTGSPWLNKNTLQWLKNADEVWDYNKENLMFLKSQLNLIAHYHPIKWVDSLRKLNNSPNPEYDILFYGEFTERRLRAIQKIVAKNRKLKIMHAYGVSGDMLDRLLENAKIVLNIHAFDGYKNQEIVRMFYPLINGKCILSEHSMNDSYAGDAIVYSDIDNMPNKITELLKDDKWAKIASNASERFKQISGK